MILIKELQNSFIKHSEKNAFCIENKFFTYNDLAKYISKIRGTIKNFANPDETSFGVVTNNDIETYAGILACLFEGKTFVPICPNTPFERNKTIADQIGIDTIIDSSEKPILPDLKVIESSKLPEVEINIEPNIVPDENILFILFTSGSTGIPKGVPLSIANFTAFVESFLEVGIKIDETDRSLQMFELTFDMSIWWTLVPLMKGACLYTLSKKESKLGQIYELLEDHKLTIATMVPSILFYLRQYFDELHLESLKYSIFGGEGLPLDIVKEWSNSIPNATIINFYGPTEHSICSSCYTISRNGDNKVYNGIISIGRPMLKSEMIIVDENNNILGPGEKGELCLGGIQVTPGYINNEEKNKNAFFYCDYKGKISRFYKSGDLCYYDEEGYFMFIGRVDFQVKINGYRVELAEVEYYAKKYLENKNVAAVGFNNIFGDTLLGLFIESEEFDTNEMLENMRAKLPQYMIPNQIMFREQFPLNKNNKTDRKALTQLLS